jgi:hypothetical protein
MIKSSEKSFSKEELIGFADQYLDALAVNDPYRLPLTKDVLFTENTHPMKLGRRVVENRLSHKVPACGR